ncbi:hypothetical protein OLP47_00080 [Campylobacter jejuni]|nr:hypothetical protein [Campylobacter jejuni]
MQNTKPIRWFTFIVLVIGGGTVFKLSSLKDALCAYARIYES